MDAKSNKIEGVKKNNRSTDIEKLNRVSNIVKAILNGYSNRKILLQYISETYGNWGVSERMIDNYIADARGMLTEIMQNDIAFEKAIALNRLNALYNMNLKIHDFRECRNIIETIGKIVGYATQNIDLTSKGNEIKGLITTNPLNESD